MEKRGVGRPFEERSIEIMEKMREHLDGTPFVMELCDGERDTFTRFSQRCRTVGRALGCRVSVKIDRKTHDTATIVVRGA